MESNNKSLIAPPTGTRDFDPDDVYLRKKIITDLKDMFELYGGHPIETPMMERIDTVTNLYGEEFDKLVYTLDQDDHEKKEKLLLRYDLTVPCARYIANSGKVEFKRYQIGSVFRKDDPQIAKGRYREFTQADFDIIGNSSQDGTMIQDLEIIKLANDVMEKILLPNTFRIKINSRKILNHVLFSIGVSQDAFATVCSTIDKLDKVSIKCIEEELLNKGISEEITNKLISYITGINTTDKNTTLRTLLDHKFISQDIFNEMSTFFEYIDQIDGLKNNIIFDTNLARGMNYYTGIIFEIEYCDKNVISSSIGSGGRYDNMIEKLSNRGHIPAIGLSIGVDRIFVIYKKLGIRAKNYGPKVFVASIGQKMEFHKFMIVNELRKQGINTDYFYQTIGTKQQFDYTLKKGIPYMIIIGETEIKNNTFKIKILKERKEIICPMGDIKNINEILSSCD